MTETLSNLNGLWSVSLQKEDGAIYSHGTVVLKDGRIFGTDSYYSYKGIFLVEHSTIQAVVDVTRYDTEKTIERPQRCILAVSDHEIPASGQQTSERKLELSGHTDDAPKRKVRLICTQRTVGSSSPETQIELEENWSVKEFYEATRKLVEHEDGLMNERLKALFTIQTILFAALGAFSKETTVKLIPLLLPLGLISTLAYGFELFLGSQAIMKIKGNWDDAMENRFGSAKTPMLMGAEVKVSLEEKPHVERWLNWLIRQLVPSRLVAVLFTIGWLWITFSYYRPSWLPDWVPQLPVHGKRISGYGIPYI